MSAANDLAVLIERWFTDRLIRLSGEMRKMTPERNEELTPLF
ncbi:hypothetical protein ABID26_007445 [Mesorhizobium shonense]|uniref:Uncharacterized protein n=1 Tax=Mesorhizobium shonense TaxID=1209948 RepID=A0ABV2I580_9HYPH